MILLALPILMHGAFMNQKMQSKILGNVDANLQKLKEKNLSGSMNEAIIKRVTHLIHLEQERIEKGQQVQSTKNVNVRSARHPRRQPINEEQSEGQIVEKSVKPQLRQESSKLALRDEEAQVLFG